MTLLTFSVKSNISPSSSNSMTGSGKPQSLTSLGSSSSLSSLAISLLTIIAGDGDDAFLAFSSSSSLYVDMSSRAAKISVSRVHSCCLGLGVGFAIFDGTQRFKESSESLACGSRVISLSCAVDDLLLFDDDDGLYERNAVFQLISSFTPCLGFLVLLNKQNSNCYNMLYGFLNMNPHAIESR